MAGLLSMTGCGGGSGHLLPQVAAGTVSAPFNTSSGAANSSTDPTTSNSVLPITSAAGSRTTSSGSRTSATGGSGTSGRGPADPSTGLPTISPSGTLPAFPGAQGAGAEAV